MTQTARLLTAAQVVERLREAGVEVVEETVRQWARAKQIPVVRLPSGRYLFRPEDVDRIPVPVATGSDEDAS